VPSAPFFVVILITPAIADEPYRTEQDSIDNQTTQIKAGNKHFDIGYLKSRNKTQYDGFGGTPTDKLGDRKLNKITINAIVNSMVTKLIMFDITKSYINI
jgi:hypothetical protein